MSLHRWWSQTYPARLPEAFPVRKFHGTVLSDTSSWIRSEARTVCPCHWYSPLIQRGRVAARRLPAGLVDDLCRRTARGRGRPARRAPVLSCRTESFRRRSRTIQPQSSVHCRSIFTYFCPTVYEGDRILLCTVRLRSDLPTPVGRACISSIESVSSTWDLGILSSRQHRPCSILRIAHVRRFLLGRYRGRLRGFPHLPPL